MAEEEVQGTYLLTEAQQVQMLRRLLFYWDGQWFLKAVEALGLDAAVALNARVRAAFGRIEMHLMLKAANKSRADDLVDAMRLIESYARAFMGRGIRAEFVSLDEQESRVVVHRCPAYEGAKLAALPRQDQGCVACETLWNVWIETLLPGARISVQYPQRQGRGDQVCSFVITSSREPPAAGEEPAGHPGES